MSARERLALDLVILAAVVAAANPILTGIRLHEWIGLVLTLPAVVHLVVNWDWVVRTVAGLLGKAKATTRLNLLVDSGLFVSLVGVTLSGFLVIPGLAASLGVQATASWHAAHLLTSDLTVAFTLAHLALHASWISDVVRRWARRATSSARLGTTRVPRNLPRPLEPATLRVPSATRATRRDRRRAEEGAVAMRYLRNTLSVLIATALTALTLYAGVEVAAGVSAATGKATATTASAGQTYMCPTTGCTSTMCHGANASAAAQAAASGSSASGAGATMTCPRTGCTASTCHGATGSPPPTSGSAGAGGPMGMGRSRGQGSGSSDGFASSGATTSQSSQSEVGLTYE